MPEKRSVVRGASPTLMSVVWWWGSGRAEIDVLGVGLAVVERSGCLSVLVDESVAGVVSSDRSAGPIRDNFVIVGRALAEAAVRSVRVVMLDVVA